MSGEGEGICGEGEGICGEGEGTCLVRVRVHVW